ncbi:hypothetical protein EJD97_014320, partial [Solanum chilense]
KCQVQRECTAQTNFSCYTESPLAIEDRVMCTNDNSKRHTSAAYQPFRWPPARSSKEILRLLHSTALRSHELKFVAFPRGKQMGAVPWVNFVVGSEERHEE